MSSVGRASSRGSKTGKGDHASTTKAQKTDTKTESAKSMENPKAQPTPEQMRIAQIIDGKSDDPFLKEKIKQVMDATHKTEMEVCTALHDCDNDLDRAVNMLIEGQVSGAWETSVKKKKNRQPSTNSKPETPSTRGVSSTDVDSENWEDETPSKPPAPIDPQQRTRSRGGSGPPRMRGRGSQDNRGWRGRENKENERNLEDGRGAAASGEREQRETYRRGTGGGGRGGRMSNGPSRGGGRGGSRSGPRSFSNRGGHDRGGTSFPRPTSWNPEEDNTDNKTSNFPSPEDWDNEEYTGSLADTKVFTPSTIGADSTASDPIASLTVNNSNSDSSHATSSGVNSNNLYSQSPMGSDTLTQAQTQYLRQLQDKQLTSSNPLSGAMSALSSLTDGSDSKTAPRGAPPSTQPGGSTYNSYAASAANTGNAVVSTSYPSTYSSVSASVPASSVSEASYSASTSVNSSYNTYQTASLQSQPPSYTATATSYTTVYGTQTPSYISQDGSTQSSTSQPLPARAKTQRPRVPPPSKIPQSAVEMPGDSINSIALLDVQFGGLDFGSDAFDTSSSDAQSSPQSQATQSQNQQSSVKYSSGVNTSVSSLESSTASTAQPNLDLDPFTTAGSKAAALTQTLKETLLQSQQQSQSQSHQPQSSAQSQSNDLKSQQSNYSQQSRGPGGVNVGVPSPLDSLVKTDTSASSGSNSGGTGSLAYSAPNSNYQQTSYPGQKSAGSGYQSSVAYNTANYSSSQTSSASVTYPNSSSTNSYSAGYPANVSSQVYPNVNVQSVYGASSNSNSGYTTSSSGAQYQNSYGTSTAAAAASANKLSSVLNASKDMSQYDTTATSTSNLSSSMSSNNSGAPGLSNVSGSVNNSPALGLPGATSLPNANTASSTKVTNSSAKSGGVPNMPPGVPPIIGAQYIMSQGGLQYFQQPVYGYDDQQMLPLRIAPPMTASYYDISFQQAPTSLATGRDGSLANVPYSMSDGRFARTDNASPVPSSLPQQNATQAHQQPMMNAAGFPPGYAYAYAYGGSVLPANYQYGTPTAMYPQVAQATNAHGNSNTTQYPKPGSYGNSYGSGYDVSQDYNKAGGYAGGHTGAQSGSKTGVGANAPSSGSSGTDLYNKTHAALNKVNSYEKQGFHSGTPPPFNLAGNQNTGMAPSGAYPPPLFIPSLHQQHHSTTLIQHPLHQMDMRNPARRSESANSSGQRSQPSAQSSKPGTKQNYSPSYWQS